MYRNNEIDGLRGIAIITMVAANYAALMLIEPHPMWFRVYGSFAAPLFIFLAGMMVPFTQAKKSYTFYYFLKRGGFIMLIGALIDVLIWQIYPFTSVDVLYLIGLSLPLSYLVNQLSRAWQLIFIALLFALPIYLHNMFNYIDYPTELDLSGSLPTLAELSNVWQHWLFDGWFPVAPWLGFAFLGTFMSRYTVLSPTNDNHTRKWLAIGLGSLSIGLSLFVTMPYDLLVRDGYSEVFYPPTLSYCMMAVGVIFLSLGLIRFLPTKLLSYIGLYGHFSLSIYVIHVIMGAFVWSIWFEELNMLQFAGVYLASLLILWWYCQIRLKLKQTLASSKKLATKNA